jgi:hypothetical protein
MADYSSINPYKQAADVLTPKPAAPAKPAATPKAVKGPDYEPLPVQPDEHSEYMGKQLAKIASKINTKGQDVMQKRLLKTGSSKASGSKS